MTPRSRAAAQAVSGVHVLADDGAPWRLGPVEQARAACDGGAAVVQLRAKRATDRETLAWADEIRRMTRACGALFMINDRFDLAIAADADGVHLGQDDLPPESLPPQVRDRLLVGRSTHSSEQARAAADTADYIAFGPVFGTHSKPTDHDARGLPALAEVVARIAPRPVVAIGGIDVARAADLREAGAAGIAVISAVAGAEDPVAATRALVRAFRGES